MSCNLTARADLPVYPLRVRNLGISRCPLFHQNTRPTVPMNANNASGNPIERPNILSRDVGCSCVTGAFDRNSIIGPACGAFVPGAQLYAKISS